MMGTIKMTLNIIITPIIITHAQSFECITKFFGEGYLAAPYSTWCTVQYTVHTCVERDYLQTLSLNIHMVSGNIGGPTGYFWGDHYLILYMDCCSAARC